MRLIQITREAHSDNGARQRGLIGRRPQAGFPSEDVYLTIGVPPDFFCGCLTVYFGIGGIPELLWHKGVIGFVQNR